MKKTTKISEILLFWYRKNKRDLPWRGINDPYKIWLSEIILQQTRVEQGTPYYHAFTKKFPTVKHLANAKEDDVLKLWQGLGYYSRARNLHAAAKQIVGQTKESEGQQQRAGNSFPATYDEIIKLKGVGVYTAAAISSICFNEAKAVVDGNVYRFISRLFGIKTPVDSANGKKEFQEMANELLDKKNPGEHNQAMMEFGARCCTPKKPQCPGCPFEEMCFARRKNLTDQLPVKEKKTKVRTRHFNYFVLSYKDKTFLKKRKDEKDIWRNLYEFPVIEVDSLLVGKNTTEEVNAIKEFAKKFKLQKKNFIVKEISPVHKHVLSHQVLIAKFYTIELLNHSLLLNKNFLAVKKDKVNRLALPRLIDKYWNKR